MAQSVTMVAETLSRLGINNILSYYFVHVQIRMKIQINIALRYLVNELTF